MAENTRVEKVQIEMEGGGIIKLELYPDVAPITVANFVKLAEEKAFDGKMFHRVIKGFVIQGGAFNEANEQSETDSIYGEFTFNGWLNLIPHKKGTISMARTMEPNSASNQFFIMHDDSVELNGNYAAFGEVTDGLEYVDEIAGVETDSSDKPIKNQVIKTVRIIK